MSKNNQLQRAATKLYHKHSSSLLTFLLPRSQFSTTSSPLDDGSQSLKTYDRPPRKFRIPNVGQRSSKTQSHTPQNHESEYLNDQPPSRHSPPFLKIIMPNTSPSWRHTTNVRGHFRPEHTPAKSLTGSTISSSEREVFAKIFDQMLTQRIPEPPSRQRFVKSKRGVEGPSNTTSATSKRGRALSVALLDESLFLTPKEVAEYPEALRPLAARIGRADHGRREVEGIWPELEKTMNQCQSDLALARFLDTEVFPLMERQPSTNGPVKGKWSMDVIRENYSLILLKAMRLYRTLFNNPLAAHTLFLRAKTLSAESYVLGCTTQLYNELLVARWERFTDLYSISEILEEMTTNGLKGDGQTIQILKNIQEDVHEWANQGNDAERVVWAAERARIGKLEKFQREFVDGIEEDVGLDDMELDLEREVRSLGGEYAKDLTELR